MLQVLILLAAITPLTGFHCQGQTEPWAEDQLMAPEKLAEKLNAGNVQGTYIFNIGPSGQIRNSITIGSVQEASNLALLKKELAKLPHQAEVVIYCGCCPFNHCPNIRPAFSLLNEMQFENARLLNLPGNLKVDWIDRGYPMQND